MISEDTKSCGCLATELLIKRNYIHGMSNSATYESWKKMLQRCNNKKLIRYKDYGGRGIKVCKRWMKFENFFKDMGERPKELTIERIDNNKGYFPKNCKWATRQEQVNNQRRNVFLEFDMKKLTISQWAKEKNIPQSSLYFRLYYAKNKMNIEKALTEPVKK